MWNPEDYGDELEVVTRAIYVGWSDHESDAWGGCVAETCHLVYVPEPSTWLLVLPGLVGLVAVRRRRTPTDAP